MPDQYTAYDAKTGRHWDWDGSKWNERPEKSTLFKAWDVANKPLVPASSIDVMNPNIIAGEALEKRAFGKSPFLTGVGEFQRGTAKSVDELLASMTSPVGVALTIASLGEGQLARMGWPVLSRSLRMLQTAAGAGFAGSGLWQAASSAQKGESTADAMERRLRGLAQAVLGTAGMWAGTEPARLSTARQLFAGGGEHAEQVARGQIAKENVQASQAHAEEMKQYQSKSAAERAADRAAHEQEIGEYEQGRASARAADKAKHEQELREYEERQASARVVERAKHEEEVGAARKGYAESVAQAERARVQASRLESARRSYSDLKDRLSEQTSNNIHLTERAERSSLDGRWAQFDKDVAPLRGDMSKVGESIVNAQNNILKGTSPENIRVFKDIVGKLGKNMVEDEAGNVSVLPGQTLGIDQLRGYYTELGEKLYGTELSGDVYHAVDSVRKGIDQEIKSSLRDYLGDDGVKRYEDLKSDWSDYMRTWRDMRPLSQGGSPLARIIKLQEAPLAMRDQMSVYRDVGNQILQKSGERISYLLARKKAFGADPALAARIRQADQQLKLLPKPGKVPAVERPEFPSVAKVSTEEPPSVAKISTEEPPGVAKITTREAPEPPKMKQFDPKEWRLENLRDLVQKRLRRFGWDDKTALLGSLYELVRGQPSHAVLSASYPLAKRLVGEILSSRSMEDWIGGP
jgi:hypothetical protein